MSAVNEIVSLQNLARAYGVETSYRDNDGQRQEASPEALLAVLRSLGAPIEGMADIASARRQRRQAYWREILEPVIVAWDGAPVEAELRLESETSGAVECHLHLESGEDRHWAVNLARLWRIQETVVEGVRYAARALVIPETLPAGYHRLTVEAAGRQTEALVISAPVKAYSPFAGEGDRVWGAFLPLYALQSKRSWGSGDFSDLAALMEWVSSLGGNVVGTLPFLASFLDKPCDPSPYSPVSRLFWNEFFIDPAVVPEMASCPEARELAESAGFIKEMEALRDQRLVDYRRIMRLKRSVLEKLSEGLAPQSGDRYRAFEEYVKGHDRLADYALFRAATESRGETWPNWPEPLRDGMLREGDYGSEAEHYHAYVQWVADEQLRHLSQGTRGNGARLYLDLPLGVHPHGYDTWRERDLFVKGAAAGAPPDELFHQGQQWGFAPLHPCKMREQGYRYPIAYLKHNMRYADVLRVDHVMGLHHLFWVPDGMRATEGVYVRYPADEMYAILSLESHRHRCLVVGENLGTVPRYVNAALARHGVQSLYVTQYEVPLGPSAKVRDAPRASVASLNTHDMPPFAGFWRGLEIERWLELGLITEAEAKVRMESRFEAKRNLARFLERRGYLKGDLGDAGLAYRACLSLLADSPAHILLVNMEDLWLETEQQNVPGVVEGHPNWQRKARYDFETFSRMPEVVELLGRAKRPADLERRA